jgi:molybdopterin synthase sulfur carrier subunit
MPTLRYFAWVREAMGRSEEQVALPADVATVADLITWLASRDEAGAGVFADRSRIRAARDGAMVALDASVAGAAEIALFPPVTGG